MVRKVMTGNSATAYGALVSGVEVVSAYPITPQTTVVEKIAEFVSDGSFKGQYICVESEHSAMASCISASQTGVRTFTATSSQGLLLMHEMVHWAANTRSPVGLVNVNRAVGPPWSIWADHTDAMAQRDTGALNIFVESAQEILDMVIQGYKVAEDPDVLLPFIINADAFFLSHTFEPVDVPDAKKVQAWLGRYEAPYPLDPDDPHGYGSLTFPHQWYMELRYNMKRAMDRSAELIPKVSKDFAKLFGRDHGGLVEEYKTKDAEVALVAMGTMVSTAREVVDRMRDEGHKVGLVKVRSFRPFPQKELRDIAERIPVLGVADRCFTYGQEGPLSTEARAAVYTLKNRPVIKNYIIGVGGRDIHVNVLRKVFLDIEKVKDKGLDKESVWVGLKRPPNEPPEVM
jgi:2-oxoisovalerate ferredoxin oxidoreductase alpha subunit